MHFNLQMSPWCRIVTSIATLALGLRCEINSCAAEANSSAGKSGRFLYAAMPGIRNYLEYGGHGLVVFDIDRGHRFVKRIPSAGLDAKGQPLNV